LLEAANGALCPRPEDTIEAAAREAMPREPELQRGDVPAAATFLKETAAKPMSPRLPERGTGALSCDPVHQQASPPLEAADRPVGQRALDPIDLPGIEMLDAQRNLQHGDRRVAGGKSRARADGSGHERDEKGHSWPGHRAMRFAGEGSCPSRRRSVE
jgi:hypothetical protein